MKIVFVDFDCTILVSLFSQRKHQHKHAKNANHWEQCYIIHICWNMALSNKTMV